MRAYSLDLRLRIVAALETGQSVAEVAERFAVSGRTVRRYRHQWRTHGQLQIRSSPGRPRRIGVDQEAALAAQVAAHPDATLAQHCQLWYAASGQRLSPAGMCRTLQRLRLTRKKSISSRRNRTRFNVPSGVRS
jgi:transposase